MRSLFKTYKSKEEVAKREGCSGDGCFLVVRGRQGFAGSGCGWRGVVGTPGAGRGG